MIGYEKRSTFPLSSKKRKEAFQTRTLLTYTYKHTYIRVAHDPFTAVCSWKQLPLLKYTNIKHVKKEIIRLNFSWTIDVDLTIFHIKPNTGTKISKLSPECALDHLYERSINSRQTTLIYIHTENFQLIKWKNNNPQKCQEQFLSKKRMAFRLFLSLEVWTSTCMCILLPTALSWTQITIRLTNFQFEILRIKHSLVCSHQRWWKGIYMYKSTRKKERTKKVPAWRKIIHSTCETNLSCLEWKLLNYTKLTNRNHLFQICINKIYFPKLRLFFLRMPGKILMESRKKIKIHPWLSVLFHSSLGCVQKWACQSCQPAGSGKS